jgi:tRNA 5-methylaminomethyl-2-thiouridine biosynthesis bifunctional protein
MHTNTSKCYDTIVIGAGIAGCSVAYALQQVGQDVLLVDRSGVAASGGSGAAGAFVSPKIGKGSPLQSLTNQAFDYAKTFYREHFPAYFTQTGVIRLPKDAEDVPKFTLYEAHNDTAYRWIEPSELHAQGITQEDRSFLFDEAGVCDAQGMCRAIWERVTFRQFEVEEMMLRRDQESTWVLTNSVETESIVARHIVLATGYQNDLLDMRYMGVRGTWGSRGDYDSELDLRTSMHKRISVSANINGVIKLGATHNKAKEPCVVCDGRPLAPLEEQAREMIDTSDFVLKETFCGMRAGSKDYFPLVGRVIDVPRMLETCPQILKGAKPPLEHIDHLYICNGLGGRGFVFAPLMAKWLAALIVEGREMDVKVNPDRLFLKWCRKL